MFNNKKQNNNTSVQSHNNDKNLPSVNMISEGTIVEGTIKSQSDIRIAGTIAGEAEVEGKVIVSSTGIIKGNVNATDADIAGKIDGEINVSNKLVLRKSALVEGDILTKNLLVEEGGQINGEFQMTRSNDPATDGIDQTEDFSDIISSEGQNGVEQNEEEVVHH